jgi:hypothetical protein
METRALLETRAQVEGLFSITKLTALVVDQVTNPLAVPMETSVTILNMPQKPGQEVHQI